MLPYNLEPGDKLPAVKPENGITTHRVTHTHNKVDIQWGNRINSMERHATGWPRSIGVGAWLYYYL